MVFAKWVRRRQLQQAMTGKPYSDEPAVVYGLGPGFSGRRHLNQRVRSRRGGVVLWKHLTPPYTISHTDESGRRLVVASQPRQYTTDLAMFRQQSLENTVRHILVDTHGTSPAGGLTTGGEDFESAVAAALTQTRPDVWTTHEVTASWGRYELDVHHVTPEIWVGIARLEDTWCMLRSHGLPVEEATLAPVRLTTRQR
ncbi:hypothetical protein ACIOC1_34060 [Streptomyces sp. NPDC088197]|uniref:hypothetical protein n=1 Tax=unclassified Streptomyces TaxID=2593676 RepID=UPI0036E65D63